MNISSTTPILHHYAPSPFSEKVRKVLAYKNLPWMSVETPPVMPKPDLLSLTGAYRKAPVMQLGRDIYCDSKLICQVIDQLKPEPPLVPAGTELAMLATERWVDQHLFFYAVALFFQPDSLAAFAGTLPKGMLEVFLQDRQSMFAQGGTQPAVSLEVARAEMPRALAAIDSQLASKAYLGGDAPTQIDFAVYNPIWFVMGNGAIRHELEPYLNLCDWANRMMALGEGARSELSSSDAIEHCRGSSSFRDPLPGAALMLPHVCVGDHVSIGASDYAPDQVKGKLVIANAAEWVLERADERAGLLRVHFPTAAFSVIKAS